MQVEDPLTQFLKYELADAKTLAIQFITLVSAILVFSITFSEKIINYVQTTKPIKILLLVSWVLFIIAIVLAGISLCYVFTSEAMLIGKDPDYEHIAIQGYWILCSAGCSFVLGLLFLLIAGMKSVWKDARADDALEENTVD